MDPMGKEMLTPLRIRFAYATARVLLTRLSCLRSLRCPTLTTVLLTPHPYMGSVPKHEHKGLERGSGGKGMKCLNSEYAIHGELLYIPNIYIYII